MTESKSIDGKLWFAYASLGVQAVVPIVLGSFKSIKHNKEKRSTASDGAPTILDPDTEDADEDEPDERISTVDSLLFPVMGSAMLVGMFFVLKYLDKTWLNWFLGLYFAAASVVSIQASFTFLLNGILGRISYQQPQKYHLRLEQGFRQLHHLAFSQTSLLVLPVSLLLPCAYLYLEKPWYLTNVLSFTFAQTSISLLKLDGFRAGMALLAGLFVYDVVWVFGSDVMVTVAKGLDAPIKILAPRDFSDSSAGQVLLGLGDIIVPGIFISLALRYDHSRHVAAGESTKQTPAVRATYSKPYFSTVLLAYIAGLIVTVVVMHTFKAAQPALLYLSPACIGSVTFLALARGELRSLWNWSDDATSSSTSAISDDKDAVKHAKILAAAEAEDREESVAQQDGSRAVSAAAGSNEGGSGEEDADWMKLDDGLKESERRKRKKSGSTKKKK